MANSIKVTKKTAKKKHKEKKCLHMQIHVYMY